MCIAAYFSLEEQHNVLIANWSEVASQEWSYSSGSANGVGYTFASALEDLEEAGMDTTTLHIVAHSLGAQIAGYIGRYVEFTLPRITGKMRLDETRMETNLNMYSYASRTRPCRTCFQ